VLLLAAFFRLSRMIRCSIAELCTSTFVFCSARPYSFISPFFSSSRYDATAVTRLLRGTAIFVGWNPAGSGRTSDCVVQGSAQLQSFGFFFVVLSGASFPPFAIL
jgi:hypothetical protein